MCVGDGGGVSEGTPTPSRPSLLSYMHMDVHQLIEGKRFFLRGGAHLQSSLWSLGVPAADLRFFCELKGGRGYRWGVGRV